MGPRDTVGNFHNAASVIVWMVSMAYGNDGSPRLWGGRVLVLAVIVVATVAAAGWSLTHARGACSCGVPVPFGRDQPGFHRLGGPLSVALGQLPVPVRLAPAIGPPAGVYRSPSRTLVLYGARSTGGVFRFTAARKPKGYGPRDLRGLAHACSVCSDNRLVALAPGVRGALLAGGNGPNSITWIERGLQMQVLGPATTFSALRAIDVASALAAASQN